MNFVAALLLSLNLIAVPAPEVGIQEVHHDIINPEVYQFTPPGSGKFLGLIWNTEDAFAIPAGYLTAILYQESHFRPDIIECRVLGPSGEKGIAQLHPRWHKKVDACNPHDAIVYAGAYLAYLAEYYDGDYGLALAAYNWGMGNVNKWLKGNRGMPVSVQRYVIEVMQNAGDVLT
jgi:soluble lytic murein transglycosylase-like protein